VDEVLLPAVELRLKAQREQESAWGEIADRVLLSCSVRWNSESAAVYAQADFRAEPDLHPESPDAPGLLPQVCWGHWNSRSAAGYAPADFQVDFQAELDSLAGPRRFAVPSGFRVGWDFPPPSPMSGRRAEAEWLWGEEDYFRCLDALRRPAELCWGAMDAGEPAEASLRVRLVLPVLLWLAASGGSGPREHC
jgi:hypothetical protein